MSPSRSALQSQHAGKTEMWESGTRNGPSLKKCSPRGLRAFPGSHGRSALSLRRQRTAAMRFLDGQRKVYPTEKDGEGKVGIDFCQLMLANKAFLYVEQPIR